MDFDTPTLRLSPFTPSLTSSPTITPSSTASPSFFPELTLPKDTWLPADSASWLLSPQHDIAPGVLILNPDPDAQRPHKKPRHSAKLDHEPVEPVLHHHHHHTHHSHNHTHRTDTRQQQPPAIVAIPPAQASDIPLDIAKKPSRKRTTNSSSSSSTTSSSTTSSSRSKAAKRKAPSPTPAAAAAAQQPVRFRFVSVQHAETTEPDVPAEFEEHMEDDLDEGPFEHGPSQFPPVPYPGGEYAVSPLQPPPKTGKIPASSLDFLPVLEARFTRLENAIEKYVALRAQQAIRNSLLPEARQGASPAPSSSSAMLAVR